MHHQAWLPDTAACTLVHLGFSICVDPAPLPSGTCIGFCTMQDVPAYCEASALHCGKAECHACPQPCSRMVGLTRLLRDEWHSPEVTGPHFFRQLLEVRLPSFEKPCLVSMLSCVSFVEQLPMSGLPASTVPSSSVLSNCALCTVTGMMFNSSKP